jgi:hypothetical protein
MPLYPPKVLRTMERALTPNSSIVFTLNSHLSLSRSLGTHQIRRIYKTFNFQNEHSFSKTFGIIILFSKGRPKSSKHNLKRVFWFVFHYFYSHQHSYDCF